MRKAFYLGLAAFIIVCSTARGVDFDPKACYTNNSEIFVAGLQRFATLKHGDGEISKTKYNPTALALGYKFTNERWVAGVSLSFETGSPKHEFHDAFGGTHEFAKVRDRTYGATLFGMYKWNDGWYAAASTFLGFANQKLKNGYAQYGGVTYVPTGSHDSGRFGASIELGKVFEFCSGFRLTPHVGFDYSYTARDKFTHNEIDALGNITPDEVYSRSQSFYELPFGLTFAKDFATCDWVITPSVDLTVIAPIGNIKDRNINYRPGFASRTGWDWKVYGIGSDKWAGRLTAGIKAVKAQRFDVELYYAYEGRKSYHDHRISALLGVAF